MEIADGIVELRGAGIMFRLFTAVIWNRLYVCVELVFCSLFKFDVLVTALLGGACITQPTPPIWWTVEFVTLWLYFGVELS